MLWPVILEAMYEALLPSYAFTSSSCTALMSHPDLQKGRKRGDLIFLIQSDVHYVMLIDEKQLPLA